jgi:agmatinase
MRRVYDLPEVGRLVQVGLRAVSDEDDSIRVAEPTRVRWFPAHQPLDVDAVLKALPARVYISFDLDGLDPSVVPGTGTPEPGGLQWWEALRLLRAVFEQRSVVGFDIVELLPQPPSIVSDFAAAKLLFKMLAYAVGP